MIGNYIAGPASGQSAYAMDSRPVSYSQGMQIFVNYITGIEGPCEASLPAT